MQYLDSIEKVMSYCLISKWYHALLNLFNTFCMDAYGSSLWCFSSKAVDSFYVEWREVVRKIWCLSNTTHCIILPTINNTLPIDVTLEKKVYNVYLVMYQQRKLCTESNYKMCYEITTLYSR